VSSDLHTLQPTPGCADRFGVVPLATPCSHSRQSPPRQTEAKGLELHAQSEVIQAIDTPFSVRRPVTKRPDDQLGFPNDRLSIPPAPCGQRSSWLSTERSYAGATCRGAVSLDRSVTYRGQPTLAGARVETCGRHVRLPDGHPTRFSRRCPATGLLTENLLRPPTT
jgi:hypothetical protein